MADRWCLTGSAKFHTARVFQSWVLGRLMRLAPRGIAMTSLCAFCTTVALTFSFLQSQPDKHPPSPDLMSLARFAGTWRGECEDGRTFVVVALKQDGPQMGGAVSMGNMHGDDEGACMLVLAPPVPEHARNVSDPTVKQNTLSFNGSKRPGTPTRFELTLLGNSEAQLKLLGSPVENHPWQLSKAQTY